MGAMRWTTCLVIAAVLAPIRAHADVAPSEVGVSTSAREEAKRLRDEGYAMLAVDRYDDAIAKFHAAIAVFPHPKLYLALGLTYMRVARWLEAEVALDKALDAGEAGLDTEFARTRAARAEVAAHLGTITITGRQAGAQLTLDGKPVLVAPGEARVRVLPGRHVVLATRGALSSDPLALDVRANDTVDAAPVIYVTETRWRWARWKPWAVIGAGAAIAVVGVPLLLHSQREYDRYRQEFDARCGLMGCPFEPPELVSIKDGARTWRYSAVGAFAGGGVVVGLGLVWLALNHPVDTRRVAPDVPRATIVPWLGGNGLSLATTW